MSGRRQAARVVGDGSLSDALFDGQSFSVLTVVDTLKREPGTACRADHHSGDMTSTLERVVARYRQPERIQVGQGSCSS